MTLIRESFLRRAIRGMALRSIAWIEETNNWDSSRNGELLALREAIKYCKIACPAADLVVIDVGANKGDYIDMVVTEAKAIGAPVWIHAFEPQAESYARLLATHGQEKKIRLNQVALSERDGDAVIFSDRGGSPLASMYERDLRAIDIELNQRENVKTVRLASYIQEARLEHVHFLKIDVEGSEFEVMNGAGDFLRPDFVDFIQFEYGGTNLDARVPLKAFYDFLEPKGYVVAKVMSGGLRVREYSSWMDNYLYANYIAMSQKAFKYLAARS